MMPWWMACLRPTSASAAPSVPRSLAVVKPAASVARAWLVARATRSASDSFSTWSFQEASLYGWRSRWEWPSMRPGSSVVPLKSTDVVPWGTFTLASGPAAAMRSPVTRTTQPVCGLEVTPSKTRSGRNR